jgi:uncharacterized protein (TIGR03437 family)
MEIKRVCAVRMAISALALGCLGASSATAQQDRITDAIDPNQVVVLTGSVHPLARPQYDQGPVASSFPLPYVSMMLKPSAAQHAALQQLLAAQRDPASPEYRRWLTPEEYADRFGVSPNDILKIRAWLESAGFKVEYTARGRDWIAFSGTAGQVQAALHTPVHRYVVNGETHFAVAADPSIPAASAPVVAAFTGLHDFYPMPAHHPKAAFNPGTGQNTLAPGDLATIYDINQLYDQGIDGTGQTIAIVGQTQLVLSDIQGFRSTFGLGNQNIQTVPTGTNPGINSDALGEADLDLEWAGSIARNASFIYVYSSDATGAAVYAIDQNLAPVVSESFGTCEANISAALVPAIETEAQKANSMGITWLVSSDDQGAAGCDYGATVAVLGLAVSFPASIPEVTAVGGTEFNEEGSFWGGNNGPYGGTALSYIPEMAWNDTAYGGGLSASGGGVSILYPKPTWQSGTGVPNDGARDVPDVAMDASNDHDPYNVLTGGQWELIGGTSAATPVFAGIIALLNQHLSANGSAAGVGNINTVLYPMAQNNPNVFHDIVVGNNIVPCAEGTPDCTDGQFGYNTAVGYDLVTGLGTVDAYNLLAGWQAAPAGQVSIASLSPASVTAGGAAFTLAVNGSNFVAGAKVNWAGTALTTTVASSTKLTAAVSAALTATAGNAAVTVTSGGKLSNALYFTINPATPPSVTLTDARVTTQAPPAAGCVVPPSQTTFSTASSTASPTVYLYFAAVVTAQDTLSHDWLAPDGSTAAGVSWPAEAGDFCFDNGASLAIGGLTGSKLGAWQARIYDNGTLVMSIPFTVSASSTGPVITGVANAASYASGVVSPGEIVALFGSGMGPAQLAGLTLNSAGKVSTSAGGTTVMFNGVAAPVIYSLATQVAVVVPYEVSGATAQVTVSYKGQTSAAFPVTVAAAVPGLFTANSSGTGQAAALNQDTSGNSVTHPAPPGSVIVLFATGEGQTTPAGVDGKLAVAPLPKPVQKVTVTIGGLPATVDYAGGAPGEVAGVMQVNATIPAGVFGSAVPIVVQVGNFKSQAGATIAVAGATSSGFSVTSQETAASVPSNNGILTCIAPPAQTSFATTAADAWVYFTFDGAQQGDVLEFNWVHPSGKVDASEPTITLNFSGPGCAAQPFPIQGAEAATEPGNWQVRVSRNNVLQFALTFSIVAPAPAFAVTAKETAGALVTDSNGNPEYCSMPPAKTAFLSTDPVVWVWFTFNGADSGDVFAFHWIHPSGQVDTYQPTTVLNFSGAGCVAWDFGIAGAEAGTEPGNWQVQVFRNGASLFTLPFTITNVAFAVTSQTTAASVNLNSDGSLSCTEPAQKTIFLTTDPAVYVWFAFTGAHDKDVFTFHWVHPSGAVDPDQPATALTFAGSGCAAWSFNIAGSAAASDPGAWWAVVLRNGVQIFSLQFTVGSSTTFAVTDQETTGLALVESCAVPPAKSVFQPTDPSIYVWFAFVGAADGDVLTYNWIHPSGLVDSFQPSTTIDFNGAGCTGYGVPIYGYEPEFDPGTWYVKVFRNGDVLFALPFTIQ